MIASDPEFVRSQILERFAHVEIYLLLGASIFTCGVVSATLMLLRRRIDRLLLWFSIFAGAYGLHLILDYQLFWWLGLYPEVFRRFVVALELLIPIPAFFFFQELDLLGRPGRILTGIISPVAVCLALATLVIGPEFRVANHVVLTIVLVVFGIALFRTNSDLKDARVLRVGLLVFIACALYDHLTGILGHLYRNVEPFGFLILIVCLGIVAGRRTLMQEQRLGLIQQELQIAQRIQNSLLPTDLPNKQCFRIAARYLPMTSVAGDFYDFIIPDEQHVGILLADVSGHGVPAALIASMVKLAVAGQATNADKPAELLRAMNTSLCGNTQGQFVTAAYLYLSASGKRMYYAAAAHPAMYLLRNRDVHRVVENGLMLGAFPSAAYTEISQALQPGDRFLLYTDGILEAGNADGEEYGSDRLAELLLTTAGMNENKAADLIVSQVQSWAASQEDDLTVIVCDYKCETAEM